MENVFMKIMLVWCQQNGPERTVFQLHWAPAGWKRNGLRAGLNNNCDLCTCVMNTLQVLLFCFYIIVT